MLYRVRFEYGRNIEASSKREAVETICKLMRQHPESFVRDVVDTLNTTTTRPLWKRFLTGR